MTIRKMGKRDISAVMGIANYFIKNTTCSWQRDERPLSHYKKWFKAHGKDYPVYVCEHNNVILGYACLSKFRGVNGYDRVLENSVYVLPEGRGNGYGRALMHKLIHKAQKMGLWSITAWIDSHNMASVEFHKNFGFYEVGMMKNIGNKEGKRLSTYILQLDL